MRGVHRGSKLRIGAPALAVAIGLALPALSFAQTVKTPSIGSYPGNTLYQVLNTAAGTPSDPQVTWPATSIANPDHGHNGYLLLSDAPEDLNYPLYSGNTAGDLYNDTVNLSGQARLMDTHRLSASTDPALEIGVCFKNDAGVNTALRVYEPSQYEATTGNAERVGNGVVQYWWQHNNWANARATTYALRPSGGPGDAKCVPLGTLNAGGHDAALIDFSNTTGSGATNRRVGFVEWYIEVGATPPVEFQTALDYYATVPGSNATARGSIPNDEAQVHLPYVSNPACGAYTCSGEALDLNVQNIAATGVPHASGACAIAAICAQSPQTDPGKGTSAYIMPNATPAWARNTYGVLCTGTGSLWCANDDPLGWSTLATGPPAVGYEVQPGYDNMDGCPSLGYTCPSNGYEVRTYNYGEYGVNYTILISGSGYTAGMAGVDVGGGYGTEFAEIYAPLTASIYDITTGRLHSQSQYFDLGNGIRQLNVIVSPWTYNPLRISVTASS